MPFSENDAEAFTETESDADAVVLSVREAAVSEIEFVVVGKIDRDLLSVCGHFLINVPPLQATSFCKLASKLVFHKLHFSVQFVMFKFRTVPFVMLLTTKIFDEAEFTMLFPSKVMLVFRVAENPRFAPAEMSDEFDGELILLLTKVQFPEALALFKKRTTE